MLQHLCTGFSKAYRQDSLVLLVNKSAKIIVVISVLQKSLEIGERHTQGLLGIRGCGPPGGAPLGEKRSGLLMRE